MRNFLVIFLLALLGAGAWGYMENPAGCKKLGRDLKADLITIYTPALANLSVAVPAAKAWLPSSVPSAPPNGDSPEAKAWTPPAETRAQPNVETPEAKDWTPPSVPSTPPNAEAPEAKAWTPPATIPFQPNWTWTTSQGTYKNVRIVKIEADCVTILHDDGGGLVPISFLPADLQKQLNYDPGAAAAAAAQRQQDEAASAQALAKERATQGPMDVVDYGTALAKAKLTGRLVLLHFTGSDWCPYCKMLDSEVLSTSTFGDFVSGRYVCLTLDFPHATPLPASVQQQNNSLAQKFGVTGFPTLLVTDSNGRELGRMSGYQPGSGPNAVISELESFQH